jgi:hypothetical protein
MKILSINVGGPKTILVDGEPIETGDSISRIEVRALRRVSIFEFTKLFRAREVSNDLLKEILSLEALSKELKDYLKRRFPS